MVGLNKVQLIGNVGADPDIRSLESGAKVANFNIATSERWNDKQTGEQKERTEWSRIVIWGPLVENVIAKYVRKGSRIYVEGKLQTRKWTDQSGVEKFTTEIVVQGFGGAVILLDGRRDDGGQAAQTQAPAQTQAVPDTPPDDSIPF